MPLAPRASALSPIKSSAELVDWLPELLPHNYGVACLMWICVMLTIMTP